LLLAQRRLDAHGPDKVDPLKPIQADSTASQETLNDQLQVDICVFCEDDDERAEEISSLLATTFKHAYGLRHVLIFFICVLLKTVLTLLVSLQKCMNKFFFQSFRVESKVTFMLINSYFCRTCVNSEWVELGRMKVMEEFKLAEEATLVVLVVRPGKPLSVRMEFIATLAVQGREERGQVMVIPVGGPTCSPNLPPPLSILPRFQGQDEELLVLREEDFRRDAALCCRLFDFLLRIEEGWAVQSRR
jgi:hypothetical protein